MWLTLILVALLSMLVGMALVLWWLVPRLENHFIFRPGRYVLKTPADLGLPFEQHFIETPDGCRLSAWHLRPERPLASLIYFHGNSGNLGILCEILALFYQHGLEVVAVDYRGYGWSTGVASEQGLYRDGLAVVRFFRERLWEGTPLLYWGRSLGGCVAAVAAREEPPDGLILETAFPSKASLLKHYPQFRWFRPFSRLRLHTLKPLKGHRFPVLVLHGDQDRTVPLEQGRRLYEGLEPPKQFLLIPGADHVNIHMLDTDGYMEQILGFIRSLPDVSRVH